MAVAKRSVLTLFQRGLDGAFLMQFHESGSQSQRLRFSFFETPVGGRERYDQAACRILEARLNIQLLRPEVVLLDSFLHRRTNVRVGVCQSLQYIDRFTINHIVIQQGAGAVFLTLQKLRELSRQSLLAPQSAQVVRLLTSGGLSLRQHNGRH